MSPRIERPLQLLIPLTLVAACTSDTEFVARMQVLHARTSAVAAAAGRCADDLRALADRDPAKVGLALQNERGAGRLLGADARSSAEIGRRSRQEIARREATMRAGIAVIANALEVGPATLDRVLAATARAQDVGRRLCEAREVAGTIALTTHGRSLPADERVSTAR